MTSATESTATTVRCTPPTAGRWAANHGRRSPRRRRPGYRRRPPAVRRAPGRATVYVDGGGPRPRSPRCRGSRCPARPGTPGRWSRRCPGMVVRVLAAEGTRVTAGQPLVVLEAMKMEHTVTAPARRHGHRAARRGRGPGGYRPGHRHDGRDRSWKRSEWKCRGGGEVTMPRRPVRDRQLLRLLRRPARGRARDAGRPGPDRRADRRLPGRADHAHPVEGQPQGPGAGYATTFLRQMEEVLGTCLERGVKVVTNAGGLNPAAWPRGWGAGRRARPGRPDRVVDRRRPRAAARRAAGRRPDASPSSIPGEPLADAGAPGHRQRLPRRLGHRRRAGGGADVVVCRG